VLAPRGGGANSGEGGGEVFESHGECSARVADDEGDELHPFPVITTGRNKGGGFLHIFIDLDVSADVVAEADLQEDNGTPFLVERGRVWRGRVRDPLAYTRSGAVP